ncbi:MAG TPA: multiheme c-type cytochrome, partial [Bryobacteraceae bacterium]|nr:multiheme c-type cytochrome [Bryobacteraceae bacterium]
MSFGTTLGILFALCVAAGRANCAPTPECAACHRQQAQSQHATGMAQTLQLAAGAPILVAHPKLTFRQGPYSYTIERQGDGSIYRVASGTEEFSSPIVWAVGLGAAGQTYLLNHDGHWYESRVSYYKQTDGLDLTVGARPDVPSSLNEAIGRELSKKGAEECFHCHATGAIVQGVLRTDKLTPGIQCARCHDRIDAHLAGLASASAPKTIPPKLGSMSSEETADFCGQCHRTWATIASEGPHNITNVRFQPYRLINSRCYDAADARIRCTSCHDPHSDAPRTLASFDKQCQSCHSASKGKPGAKLCKVAKSECAGCHMPKVEIKE